jgi:erythromycin esterase
VVAQTCHSIQNHRKVDPQAVKTAIEAYRCFEPYGRSVEDYARATVFVPDSCEDEVVEMLVQLCSKAGRYKSDGLGDREAYFNAEQNAVIVIVCTSKLG